ncbi:sulfur carrier protein ThiS [Paenibacillus albidus]|uniref:Sulfur carrier protein ThiS n=1 Tax=Paenibacillus albidus TaxID=2041023 RepID=A0A917FKA1_9BACL|nr:sulfur carrier protein ThiS [Paenibacillus albidus]GGF86093.1 sulfur carrier protein ThiS [Paenibacillus albidus]
MKLLINGKPVESHGDCRTVADLISLPEWSGRLMIIELNGEIISKENYEHILLAEGDRLELVHFVGGG